MRDPNFLLQNQVALVTGGTSGIGEGSMRCMAQAGAAVGADCVSHPEAGAQLLKLIPSACVGLARDIGDAAVWLASGKSDYVRRSTLFVYSGMTLFPVFATRG